LTNPGGPEKTLRGPPEKVEKVEWCCIMWRFRPIVLIGALWATLAARRVRRELRSKGIQARAPRPPRLGRRAGLGVTGALSRLSPTCLERALVLQAWLASQGIMRDVVIGVPPEGMKLQPAHAWVDGTDTVSPAHYLELHRLPPVLPG